MNNCENCMFYEYHYSYDWYSPDDESCSVDEYNEKAWGDRISWDNIEESPCSKYLPKTFYNNF